MLIYYGVGIQIKISVKIDLLAHDEPSPLQIPQASSTADPFGVPAQSAHVEPSPLQTPHSSSTALPPKLPAQSSHKNLQSYQ